MKNNRSNRGVTLIELLVVIAIISLLISILLPCFSFWRAWRHKLICNVRQQQIAMAVGMYRTAFHEVPLPKDLGADPNRPDVLSEYGLDHEAWVCPGAAAFYRDTTTDTSLLTYRSYQWSFPNGPTGVPHNGKTYDRIIDRMHEADQNNPKGKTFLSDNTPYHHGGKQVWVQTSWGSMPSFEQHWIGGWRYRVKISGEQLPPKPTDGEVIQ